MGSERETDRLWAELRFDAQGEAHFICHTKDEDFAATKTAFQKFINLLQRQIASEKDCPFFPSSGQDAELAVDSMPDAACEQVQKLVGYDIMDIVMDLVAGRKTAGQTMDRVADYAEASYHIGRTQVPTTNSPAPRVCPDCHHAEWLSESGTCQHYLSVERDEFYNEKRCGHKCSFPSVSVGEVVGWLDIESAPRGTLPVLVAKFQDGYLRWWEKAWWREKGKHWRTSGGICEPTHYLPLPAPPENRNDDNPVYECDGSNCPPRAHDHKP